MESLKPRLKVHIVVIGTEVDRVVKPLKEQKADRIYILYDEEPDDITSFYKKQILAGIKTECPFIPKEEIRIELYPKWADLSSVMATMTKIIQQENADGNEVYVNISSGGKLSSIAGTIISLMYGAKAYYSFPKRYDSRETKEPSTTGYTNSILLPTYTIQAPPQELLEVMAIINKYDRATQKTVVQELVKAQKLRTLQEKSDRQLNANALYALFRRKYLIPLEEKEWVRREGRRRNTTLMLTKEGKNTLKTFY